MEKELQLIECPRDAMQGWKNFIPTEQKVTYLKALLKCGFHTLDFGSFVSPKAIPQMADTREVLKKIENETGSTKLLAIIANTRGAEEAAVYERIKYLGFPFSVSPTFQLKNTNSTLEESLVRLKEIQEICIKNNKELVVYLSMAFGNPYGDAYSEEDVFGWADKCRSFGVRIISLADTVGLATADQVNRMTSVAVSSLHDVIVGVHLHSTPLNWKEKLEAAYTAGCRRFDGAVKGIGGCPMAGNELVGNMNTEWVISYFNQKGITHHINEEALQQCSMLADRIFL